MIVRAPAPLARRNSPTYNGAPTKPDIIVDVLGGEVMSDRPQHLDFLFADWPYEFGEVAARVVRGADARQEHLERRHPEGQAERAIAVVRKEPVVGRPQGLPGRHELMGVLRYRPGEEYRPHHDYLPEDAVDYSDVRRAGQRRATLLTPLNAAYEGGETLFPRLGLRFRLAAGDSLLFENTADGEPIADSLHAGAPVASGEKWMLTLWLREKRFWFWP